MGRMTAFTLAVMVLCLTARFNVTLADGRVVSVVADGYSYLGDNDTIKTARERAMAEAERSAVEQGSYSYLESQTIVKNYQVASDEIKSRVKGLITRKNIVVDELEKESLRYHIRIEAEVKFADLDTISKQPETTDFQTPDQPQAVAARSPHNDHSRRSSKEDNLAAQNNLRRLKNEQPYKYIQLMVHFQPKLENARSIIRRLRRVRSRDRGAAAEVRKLLSSTPSRERGKLVLRQRIRFLKRKRPRDYVFMMEILYPEVRPLAMGKKWRTMTEEERQAVAAFVTFAPAH